MIRAIRNWLNREAPIAEDELDWRYIEQVRALDRALAQRRKDREAQKEAARQAYANRRVASLQRDPMRGQA